MRRSRCIVVFLVFVCCAGDLYATKKEVVPPEVLSAKTVFVVARVGTVGAGKYTPDANRAKSQVEKALRKWGRYELASSAEKADIVMIITEGHTGTYGSVYGAPGGNLGSGGGSGGPVNTVAFDVLSDTLAIYKAGAVDENEPPLWKATETGDDFDWPAERVIKKFRKAVEKAAK